MDNAVTLELDGTTYTVIKFEGWERLNTPFKFSVRFLIDSPLTNSPLGSFVTLSMPTGYNKKRQWHGIIETLSTQTFIGKSSETQSVTLELYHPLHQLSYCNQQQQFYNKDELTVACHYLTKHNISFELLGLNLNAFDNKPMLHQLEQQSDLDFMQQLLCRIGVMYFIKADNTVCLFKNLSFLANSEIDTLSYLPKQIKQVIGVPHFYKMQLKHIASPRKAAVFSNALSQPKHPISKGMKGVSTPSHQFYDDSAEYHHLDELESSFQQKLSKNHLKIFSSVANLKVAEHLNLCFEDSQPFAHWHVITTIIHKFCKENEASNDLLNNETYGYHNEVTLQTSNASILPPLKNHQAKNTHFATVHTEKHEVNLGDFGGYQYQLNQSLPQANETNRLYAQPYIPRLSAYAGTNQKGLHFPLQKNDEILLSYLNGAPEKPLIVANINSTANNSYALYKNTMQSILCPSIDLLFLFNDEDKKNNIKLSAKNNAIELNAFENEDFIAFNAAQNLSIKSQQDLTLQAENNQLEVMNDLSYQSTTDIKTDINNNFYHSTTKKTSLKAKTHHAKVSNRWQTKTTQTQLNIEDTIKIIGKKGNIQLSSPKALMINTTCLEVCSQKQVSLGLKTTFINATDSSTQLLAKRLNSKIKEPINYLGKVNQKSSAKKLSPTTPQLKPSPIKHKTTEQENTTAIFNLNWLSSACHISDKAKINFNIRGYKKGDKGRVIIYQCTATDDAKINSSSMLEQDKNETLKEIKSIKFKVGDKSLYQFPHEYNKDPGTAFIQVPWQYSKLTSSNEKLTYYRFEIELLGEKEPEISCPMQWLKDIELTHVKQANVHAVKVNRQQLPKLTMLEDDPLSDEVIEITLEQETIHPLIDNKATLKNIPINSTHNLTLLSKEKQAIEVISEDYQSVFRFYELRTSNDNKKEQRDIYSIAPPVIINLNDVTFDEDNNPIINNPSDAYARLKLTDEELNYFKENGNNATLFIHGFNVPYGEFGYYPKEVSTKYDNEKLEHFISQLKVRSKSLKKHYLISDIKYDLKNTVKQNAEKYLSDKFKTAKDEKDFYFSEAKNDYIETFNGKGMHSWLIDFEDNLNKAAGFDNDYRDFSRAIFIAWPGEPKSPADYMAANAKSKQIGRAFAEVLIQLREFSKDMEINVIAHSQGNGVMLSAFDYLGEHHRFIQVDNAFAWQAALPYTALNSELNVGHDPAPFLEPHTKATIKHKRTRNPWYLPFAFKASKKITVLYSQNDNIVGKVIEQEDQLEGVKEKDVFDRKPFAEYLAGIFTTYLGLGSLYEAANQLSFPASHLLEESKLEGLWQSWVKSRPHNKISLYDNKNKFLKYSELDADLNKQIDCLGKEQILHDFCHEISSRIIKNKHKIKEKIAWLKDNEYLKGKGAYILLKYLGELENELVDTYINKKSDKNVVAKLLLNSNVSDNGFVMIIDTLKNYLYHEKIQPHLPWLVKMITFVYCSEIATNQKPINGMGWFGADMDNSELKEKERSGNLYNIECTPWVYHHSDMKVPSKDIMEEIYKKRIMFYMHFGKYENTGNGVET